MMERKIIYYPTIIVPSLWAKWAVLYFDKVGSIIPRNVDFEELVHSWNKKDFQTMKILIDEDELEPTDPQDLLKSKEKWNSVETFEEEFKRIVTSETFQSIIYKNWKRNFVWKVHRDKISDRIYEFLYDRGLAEENKKVGIGF